MAFLIVGLGNPGDEYAQTRHNVGMRVVKVLGELWTRHAETFGDWKKKFDSMYAEGRIGGEKVVLLYPLTFMNNSGDAVQPAAAFWKIAPADVLVIYDDKDLPLGEIRIRRDGSAGGHNGMRSVIERLGTSDVPRVRIGIGTEAMRERDIPAADYVLGKFSKEEDAVIKDAIDRAAKAVETILSDGIDKAMNAFNKA